MALLPEIFGGEKKPYELSADERGRHQAAATPRWIKRCKTKSAEGVGQSPRTIEQQLTPAEILLSKCLRARNRLLYAMSFFAAASMLESALEFLGEVAAGLEEYGFSCARFASQPLAELIARSDSIAAFAADRHSRFGPALRDGHGLAEKFGDLGPATEVVRSEVGSWHRVRLYGIALGPSP